jgi:hypothetical protein
MNRLTVLISLTLVFAISPARAEFLQMDLSIFGMD